MSRYFSFNSIGVCQTTGINFDALCVTYGNNEEVGALQLFGDLEASIKECSILPDCLVIIASTDQINKLYGYWDADLTQQQTVLDRGVKNECSFIKSYYFYAWGVNKLDLIKIHQVAAQPFDINIETRIQL